MGDPEAGRYSSATQGAPVLLLLTSPGTSRAIAWLRFTLDEESDVTFVDALRRVRLALDATAEQDLFAKRPWYAERSDKLAVAMATGDADATKEFIVLHRPLLCRISRRLVRIIGWIPRDAEQIGVIGLIPAARRFDPERGYSVLDLRDPLGSPDLSASRSGRGFC